MTEETNELAGDAKRVRLPVTDWSKLRIIDNVIHYRLYQQDGSMQAMTCQDTIENRNFVSWVQIHDRNVGWQKPSAAKMPRT